MLMRNILTVSLLFVSILLIGQDVHFTQFTYAPQSYNPSLIGGYSGTYRASGIIRDQSYGENTRGYQTLEINVDAPIIRGFRNQDWIGVGVSFDQDKRGSYNLQESITRLGAAYHIGLDKKSTRYFSVGVQFVNSSLSLENMPNLPTAGAIVTLKQDPDLQRLLMSTGGGTGGMGNDGPSANFKDWIAGFSYTAKSKKGNFKIGLSASQFLKNKVSFRSDFDDPFKVVGFFQMFRLVNKQLAVEPALVFQTIGRGGGFEISAHNMFSYKLKKDSDLRLKAGIGARTGSFAPQFLVGASYKGFSGGIAYDIPVNGVQGATQTQQAFEMALGYIGIIAKKPKTEPIILCPRL